MADNFPRCARQARALLKGSADLGSYSDLRELLCGDCEFFDPGEDEDLECSSFQLLRRLLESGRLSVEDLLRASTG